MQAVYELLSSTDIGIHDDVGFDMLRNLSSKSMRRLRDIPVSQHDIINYPILVLLSEINMKKQFAMRLHQVLLVGLDEANQAAKVLIGDQYHKLLIFNPKIVVESITRVMNDPDMDEETKICVVELLVEIGIIRDDSAIYSSEIWLELEFLTEYGKSYGGVHIDLYTKCLFLLTGDIVNFRLGLGSNYTVLLRGEFMEICSDYRLLESCLCGDINKYYNDIHDMFARIMKKEHRYDIFNTMRKYAKFRANLLSFIMTNLLNIKEGSPQTNNLDLSIHNYYFLLMLYFKRGTVESLFAVHNYKIDNSQLMDIWLNKNPRCVLLDIVRSIGKSTALENRCIMRSMFHTLASLDRSSTLNDEETIICRLALDYCIKFSLKRFYQ